MCYVSFDIKILTKRQLTTDYSILLIIQYSNPRREHPLLTKVTNFNLKKKIMLSSIISLERKRERERNIKGHLISISPGQWRDIVHQSACMEAWESALAQLGANYVSRASNFTNVIWEGDLMLENLCDPSHLRVQKLWVRVVISPIIAQIYLTPYQIRIQVDWDNDRTFEFFFFF